MENINFFESIEYLEPRCPKCDAVLEYGVNTKFDPKLMNHICKSCGAVLQ
jgi:phage FluMu protein Com